MLRSSALKGLLALMVTACLVVMPLPEVLRAWRPDWLLLLILIWGYRARRTLSLTGAFCLGLLLDILLAAPLATHAVPAVVVAFGAAQLPHRRQPAPLPLMMWHITAWLALAKATQLVMQHLADWPLDLSSALATLVSTVMIWPLLQAFLPATRRR